MGRISGGTGTRQTYHGRMHGSPLPCSSLARHGQGLSMALHIRGQGADNLSVAVADKLGLGRLLDGLMCRGLGCGLLQL